MGEARIDPKALEMVSSDVLELVRERLPLLANEVRLAGGEHKRKGSITITVDMTDDPGTEKRPGGMSLVVSARTSLPTEVGDTRKVIWDNGQMSLL